MKQRDDPRPDGVEGAFLQGLVAHVGDLLGDAAGAAAFRFAAFNEGRRIASQHHPDDLSGALARLDHLLGHTAAVVADGRVLVLRIHGSSLLASPRPLFHSIVLGAYEGALQALRNRRHVASILTQATGPLPLSEAGQRGQPTVSGQAGPTSTATCLLELRPDG